MPKTAGSKVGSIVIQGVGFAGKGKAAVYYYVNGTENSLRRIVVRGKGDKGPFTVAWDIARSLRDGKTVLKDGNKEVDLMGDRFLYKSKVSKYRARTKRVEAKKATVKQGEGVIVL